MTPSIVPTTAYWLTVARYQATLSLLQETTANVGSDATDSDGVRVSSATTMVNVTTGAYGSAPIDNDFGFM